MRKHVWWKHACLCLLCCRVDTAVSEPLSRQADEFDFISKKALSQDLQNAGAVAVELLQKGGALTLREDSAIRKPRDVTFFSVAFARNSMAHLTRTHIRSLRELGGFDGPIVIGTDMPGCLAKTLGPMVLGEGAQPVTKDNVAIFPDPKGASATRTIHIIDLHDTQYVRGPAAWPKMGYELVKTAARQLCSKAHLPTKLDIVIIIDSDIITTQPVLPFLQSLSHVKTPMAVFHEKADSDQKFHCGFVVSLPGSDKCLSQWEAEITGKWGTLSLLQGDGQYAFIKTQCASEGLVEVMPSNLGTPSNHQEMFFGWPTPESCSADKAYTFMHLTQFRLEHKVSERVVQDFLDRNFKRGYDITGAASCASD